jgi:hypothetical protein
MWPASRFLPAVVEALAVWVADGKPPVDLTPMAVTSFKDEPPATIRGVQVRRMSHGQCAQAWLALPGILYGARILERPHLVIAR